MLSCRFGGCSLQVWRRVWRLGGRLCMLIVRVKNSHRMLCSRFVPDYFGSFRKCLLCFRLHQSMLVLSSQALVDDALEQSFGHRSMTTWTTFAHLTLAAIEGIEQDRPVWDWLLLPTDLRTWSPSETQPGKTCDKMSATFSWDRSRAMLMTHLISFSCNREKMQAVVCVWVAP